jgi:hypothetical protein
LDESIDERCGRRNGARCKLGAQREGTRGDDKRAWLNCRHAVVASLVSRGVGSSSGIRSNERQRKLGQCTARPRGPLDGPEVLLYTIFNSLAASGWYTAALTMQLLVKGELKPAGGVIGLGFEELRWPKPVRPVQEGTWHRAREGRVRLDRSLQVSEGRALW